MIVVLLVPSVHAQHVRTAILTVTYVSGRPLALCPRRPAVSPSPLQRPLCRSIATVIRMGKPMKQRGVIVRFVITSIIYVLHLGEINTDTFYTLFPLIGVSFLTARIAQYAPFCGFFRENTRVMLHLEGAEEVEGIRRKTNETAATTAVTTGEGGGGRRAAGDNDFMMLDNCSGSGFLSEVVLEEESPVFCRFGETDVRCHVNPSQPSYCALCRFPLPFTVPATTLSPSLYLCPLILQWLMLSATMTPNDQHYSLPSGLLLLFLHLCSVLHHRCTAWRHRRSSARGWYTSGCTGGAAATK